MGEVPTFYDIELEQTRPVTQADVDELVQVKRAYGMIRGSMQAAQLILEQRSKELRNG